jgi:hypothetical protein
MTAVSPIFAIRKRDHLIELAGEKWRQKTTHFVRL